MTLEANILKGKYFPYKSKERLHAVMISLLLFLPGLALIYDLYESVHYGFTLMSKIEFITLVLFVCNYILFPRYMSISLITKVMLIIFSVFLLTTLVVKDYNQELSLFWFATLPIVPFFFLGIEKGKKWVAVPLVGLLILWVLHTLGLITLLYPKTLLVQLIFAYVGVSYIMYVMEKERSMSESKLSRSIEGNKVLFKEVHHRTKNNMQVMMGLLETQSFKIQDPKYKKMFQAHVDRIKSMSYVHENLYSGDSYDEVDMHKYLGEILHNLQRITQHTIITDIDYMRLDIKDSISLGLIVNEAVSNAIEHAYSVGSERIDVTLKCHGEECTLIIKDEGLGFNTEKEFQSLGMTLIEDLSGSLPHGKLDIYVENGTTIQVKFNAKETK